MRLQKLAQPCFAVDELETLRVVARRAIDVQMGEPLPPQEAGADVMYQGLADACLARLRQQMVRQARCAETMPEAGAAGLGRGRKIESECAVFIHGLVNHFVIRRPYWGWTG